MRFNAFSEVRPTDVIRTLSAEALLYFAEGRLESGIQTAGWGKFVRSGADIYLGDGLGFPTEDGMGRPGMGVTHPEVLKFIVEKTTGKKVATNLQIALEKHRLYIDDFDFLVSDAGHYLIEFIDGRGPTALHISGQSAAYGRLYTDVARTETGRIAKAILEPTISITCDFSRRN